MVYTFGLDKHANIRYRDSVNRLSHYELLSMLHSLSIDCEIVQESMGGADFLSFECRPLSGAEVSFLSGHSSVAFMAEKNGDALLPLPVVCRNYLEEDLPEILKYKGKTSAPFIRLMINMALSLTSFPPEDHPLTVLDPLCGKGTVCFCALQAGMNAVGLDQDRKAVREASDFFSRYLKVHLLKHTVRTLSETAGKSALPVTEFVFSDSKEHFQQKDTRFLRLASGDTADAFALCRHHPAHLLVADLPYGIQHAPSFGSKPESFVSLLRRALPRWKKALLPGGVMALSFNTLTLPARQVFDAARDAGLSPCEEDRFMHLRHEVEQAVVRDVVFLKNNP